MVRDLDLVRDILLMIEAHDSDHKLCVSSFTNDDYDEKTVSGHIELLIDADYIEAIEVAMMGQSYSDFIVKRITMAGYDYLDSVRSDAVWEATKKQFKDLSQSVPLEIAKALAITVLKAKLGI